MTNEPRERKFTMEFHSGKQVNKQIKTHGK